LSGLKLGRVMIGTTKQLGVVLRSRRLIGRSCAMFGVHSGFG
jgi:hypothetical protein